MTLLSIQSRFREIGRIRTGERVTRGGKTFPTSLSTFRLTSSDEQIIRAAAERYGGTPKEGSVGWEVVTESDRLNVMLPPRTEPYTLNYELWSGGGIQRRCDGRDAIVGGVESVCLCDPDNRECAPTLRASFLMPDLPGLGVWRLETHGYNAAAELPGSLNLLAELGGTRIMRGVLRLEQRTVKADGQTKRFVVPVLDPEGTINDLMAAAPEPVPQLVTRESDDLPLLPHEIDQPGLTPVDGEAALAGDASPIEPAGAEVREDSVGSSPSSPPAEAAGHAAPGGEVASASVASPPDIPRRYAWAEEHGWDALALDEHAVEAMGQTVMEMSSEEWRVFAATIKDGPAAEPPKPRTDEYKALSPVMRANARAYWEAQTDE
jgi:hypothetical protein